MGILERVDNSYWTILIPVLKENGDIRMCGDYKITINKYLENCNYPLPCIDKIFASSGDSTIFTKLDLSNAYNQLELDDQYRLLCTWIAHTGTPKVERLPFTVKTTAAILQKTVENLLLVIPNVVVYRDGIIISAKNLEQF